MKRILGTTMAIGMVFAALPSHAHNLNPSPSRVTGISASGADGTIAVNGTATFGGQAPLSVGSDPAGDTSLPPWYDLTNARIAQLDPATGNFTFILDLAGLPATGGMPEAARYIWDFGIDMGGETPVKVSIEGKFTDVVRNQMTTIPAFQLRGSCVSDPQTNVITCAKVADLTAEMVASEGRIFVDVPKSILEQEAKGSIAGRNIVFASICEGISTKVSAYFSLCNGAGTNTGDQLVQDAEVDFYTIASKRVRVTATPSGGGTARTVEATLSGDGSFSASLAGLAPGSYDVVAEACYGTNCGAAATTVTV